MERNYKAFNERKGIPIAHRPLKFLVSRSFLIKSIFCLPEMEKKCEIENLKQENKQDINKTNFKAILKYINLN